MLVSYYVPRLPLPSAWLHTMSPQGPDATHSGNWPDHLCKLSSQTTCLSYSSVYLHSGVFTLHSSSFRSPSRSPTTHARYVEKYGRNVRIRGLGPVGASGTDFGIQLIPLYHSGMNASCPLILSLCLMFSRIVPSTRNPGSHVD